MRKARETAFRDAGDVLKGLSMQLHRCRRREKSPKKRKAIRIVLQRGENVGVVYGRKEGEGDCVRWEII